MAADIVWDPINRDLVFAKDGDFEITDNPSTQNGGILLEGRAMNILQPAFGVGFNQQILGGPRAQAAAQLNRWQAQVVADGGKANWQSIAAPDSDFTFNANVDYL